MTKDFPHQKKLKNILFSFFPLQLVTSASPTGPGPKSLMTSLWHDHTSLIASGVPIPAPRGSPAGPNQWFCGAPVVRARMPA
jgi:hypothetical protein